MGGVIGFFVGGILSLFLLPLAIGFATGLVVYHLMQTLVGVYLLSVVLGVIFFVVGLFLSLKLLALASVVFGSLLLFDVLVFFHFPGAIALLIAILMGVIGFWVQDGFESKGRRGLNSHLGAKATAIFSCFSESSRSSTFNNYIRFDVALLRSLWFAC